MRLQILGVGQVEVANAAGDWFRFPLASNQPLVKLALSGRWVRQREVLPLPVELVVDR